MNESYKKIGYLFEKVDEHRADSRMIAPPGKDADGVFTYGISLHTMKDGRKLEFCLWIDPDIGMDMSFWDISMEKNGSGFKDTAEYLEYLSSIGFYLENVEDKYGKWNYWVIPKEKFFRIQYGNMNEW